MSCKKNKLCFTLIEIMIAITIIASFSVVVGIKINKSICNHKFKKQTKEVLEKLKFARQMAIINQYDVEVNFFKKGDSIFCEMGFDGETFKKKSFYNSFDVAFKIKEKEEKLPFAITFFSTGNIYPCGKIILSPKSKEVDSEEVVDLEKYFLKEIFLNNKEG